MVRCFARNYIWAIIILLFITKPCFGQEVNIADIIIGNFGVIGDMHFGSNLQRYYILQNAEDSVSINNKWIQLKSFPDSLLYFGDSYFTGIDLDGNVDFIQSGGGKLVLSESSIYSYTVFLSDTFFVADTFFVKGGPENSTNMVALEFDFEGNYIYGKHWPSPYNCYYNIVDIGAADGRIYLTGIYVRDTLQLDDQKIGAINKEDVFVAALDQSLTCKWLTRLGYDDFELPTSIDVNSAHDVLTAGYYASGIFLACEDTLFNPFGFATEDAFISIMDSTGDCKWTEGIHGTASQSVWSAKYLSDASVIVAGQHRGNADFGDTVLTGPVQTTNGFIAKYDGDGNLKFAIQLEGNAAQSIIDMVVTPDDNIWVCGYYSSNPLIIGDIELYVRSEGIRDAYVAKFDKNGNALFAQSFGGKDFDSCLKLETGPGNSVYVIMNTKSDTVDIGDEILVLNTDFTNNIIIRIDDTTTSVKIPKPSIPEIRIYPNPVNARDQIFIDFDQTRVSTLQGITLFNLNGQKIGFYRPEESIPQSLAIPDIATGIYILNLDFGSYRISEKIVVVR